MTSSKKKEQKRSSARTTVFVILVAVLILVAAIAAVLLLTKDQQKQGQPADTEPAPETTAEPAFAPAEPMDFAVPGFTQIMDANVGQVDPSLRVRYIGSFSGDYMEDGSDEPVENVLAMIVENTGDDWIEDAELTLPCGSQTAHFHVSGMINGSMALLLAQDRVTYTAGAQFGNPACGPVAKPIDKVFDYSADFALYVVDGFVNLENVSEKACDSDVCVYYKNVKNGLLWGGITYMVRFNGPVASGEIRQLQASHFTEADSQIVYLGYAG